MLFPSEQKDTYFIPRCVKINPRGKLFDKYRNLRKKLKNIGLLKTEKISSPSDYCQEKQLSTEEGANENKIWLKHYKDGWNLILKKWASTTNFRRSEILQLSSTPDIFNQWPLFKDSRSPSLVDIDFSFLFPEKENKLLVGWGQQKENYKQIFDHSLTDIGSRSLFRKLADSTNESSDDCLISWCYMV